MRNLVQIDFRQLFNVVFQKHHPHARSTDELLLEFVVYKPCKIQKFMKLIYIWMVLLSNYDINNY